MTRMRNTLIGCALVAGLVPAIGAQQTSPSDVTQWRGANRDGAIAGFSEPRAWPEQLNKRWTIEVGLGYATPLVVGNRIYMFSRQADDEVMSAIDAASGKVLWRTAYAAPFTMNKAASPHGPGPKSTPVFSNGRLYAIGMTGIVTAYDAASGKQLWQKPGSSLVPFYTTHSFSPVIERDTVIFHVGGHDQGALTAYDVNTGAVRWTWAGDGPGYGSPIVATLGGVRQLVTITQKKVIGVDLATGMLLWERPHVSPNNTNGFDPVVVGQTVVVAGNGGPMVALTVARRNNQWVAETLWENEEVPLRFSNLVVAGNVLVGLSSRNMGQYFGIDAKTGKTLWTSEPRQAGNAAMARAGNVVFSLENDGDLLVTRATPTAMETLKRYKVGDTETWTQAAISGNRIFVKDVSTLTLWTLS